MEETARFFLEEGFFDILIKDLEEKDREILTKIYIEKIPEEKICQKSF